MLVVVLHGFFKLFFWIVFFLKLLYLLTYSAASFHGYRYPSQEVMFAFETNRKDEYHLRKGECRSAPSTCQRKSWPKGKLSLVLHYEAKCDAEAVTNAFSACVGKTQRVSNA